MAGAILSQVDAPTARKDVVNWRKIPITLIMAQVSDRIAFVAVVGTISDRNQTIHSWGSGSAKQLMAFPDVVLVEGDRSSVMLYRYRDNGEFCGDTWHGSLGDAQEQAEDEYGTALGPWSSVPPEIADAHQYAITLGRKRRDP